MNDFRIEIRITGWAKDEGDMTTVIVNRIKAYSEKHVSDPNGIRIEKIAVTRTKTGKRS